MTTSTPASSISNPSSGTFISTFWLLSSTRNEKRLSESIDPEAKEKINRHLTQTREQQDRLKLTIRALGGEPLTENGRLPVPFSERNDRKMEYTKRKRGLGVND